MDGDPGLGQQVDLHLDSPNEAGMPYVLAGGSDSGPTLVEGWPIPLDLATAVVVMGTLDAAGKASVPVPMPSLPSLGGQSVYCAFATVNLTSPYIRTVSNGVSFRIGG